MPHVPGAEVAVFERGDLRHHEYEGPHQDRLDAAYRLVEFAAEHGSMTRLPVEYRTFVRNGSVRAISAHYIQQPLRRNDAELRPAAAPQPVPRCCPPSPTISPAGGSPPSGPSPAPDTPPIPSNPDVNTLLPLAHGTCSTFTPRQRRHDTRHGAYRSHAGIRPHDRCRHWRTGCRSYRGARFPHVPHRARRHDGSTDTVNGPSAAISTCLTYICVTPNSRRSNVVRRMGLSSSRVVVVHAHETRKSLAFSTASAQRDAARGLRQPLGPAQRACTAGARSGDSGGRRQRPPVRSVPVARAGLRLRVVLAGRLLPWHAPSGVPRVRGGLGRPRPCGARSTSVLEQGGVPLADSR